MTNNEDSEDPLPSTSVMIEQIIEHPSFSDLTLPEQRMFYLAHSRASVLQPVRRYAYSHMDSLVGPRHIRLMRRDKMIRARNRMKVTSYWTHFFLP